MANNKNNTVSFKRNHKIKGMKPAQLVRSYELTFVDLRLDNKQPRKTRIEKATSVPAAIALFKQHENEHMKVIAHREVEVKPASLDALQMLATAHRSVMTAHKKAA